jgi:hypothetical protein
VKVFGADGKEIMAVSSIERQGSRLVVKGKIFGAMPMTAQLKPSEVRKALRMMNWKTLLFVLTLPFRRG